MTDLNRRSALTLALAATAAAAAGNPAAAQDQKDARIDPASIDALRIYPPLGIARVGNAAEAVPTFSDQVPAPRSNRDCDSRITA